MSRLGEKLKTPALLIKRPHLTEKAAGLSKNSDEPVYVFKVAPEANKILVKKAIVFLYKVTPRRVNIIKMPAKTIIVRGKPGRRPGYKKAIVYLKKGDKIDVA